MRLALFPQGKEAGTSVPRIPHSDALPAPYGSEGS
jgi:hypothetical protein